MATSSRPPANRCRWRPFTAQRVDYSLHRLSHYTATSPAHFQNFVLFTNYQFYIDEFCQYARDVIAKGEGGYTEFVEPGNLITRAGETAAGLRRPPARLPQMPAYHLKRKDHGGSPWSISASARPTPRRSPTISRCCARTPG
jgi:hypothetical protein